MADLFLDQKAEPVLLLDDWESYPRPLIWGITKGQKIIN